MNTAGHTACVHALLAVAGIDANLASTDDGLTALMLAVDGKHPSCVRALAAAKGISINLRCPQFGNKSALHDACEAQSAEMAEVLLLAGGCRFLHDEDGKTPLGLAAGHKGVVKVFASGVDYWQRRRHGTHAWAMKGVVTTLLLVRQRLGVLAPAAGSLRCLPEEIWLAMCCFLRGADFTP